MARLSLMFLLAAMAEREGKRSTIYIETLGTRENADIIRETIEVQVAQSKTFALVTDGNAAEIVVSGLGEISRETIEFERQTINGPRKDSFVRTTEKLLLKATDKRTGRMFWAWENTKEAMKECKEKPKRTTSCALASLANVVRTELQQR